nr:hypothetical protein DVH24_020327 [Ipomoea batatas]
MESFLRPPVSSVRALCSATVDFVVVVVRFSLLESFHGGNGEGLLWDCEWRRAKIQAQAQGLSTTTTSSSPPLLNTRYPAPRPTTTAINTPALNDMMASIRSAERGNKFESQTAILHVLVEDGEDEAGEQGEGVAGPRVGFPEIEQNGDVFAPVEGHVHHLRCSAPEIWGTREKLGMEMELAQT